ncbi:MAG TPA: FIST N-terminal domain-containing protein [Acidimicrobiales bacterium]|nr:FIST N-terminal domain-containing protein [Acidimicrobiales bacterium]
MPFAAALSEHPLTAHAAGEVTGAVLETLGERPDLALVFVTPPHAGALEDVMRTVQEVLHPMVAVGAAAESVVGPHREIEGTAAVTLFAGHVGPVVAAHLEIEGRGPDDDIGVRGWPESLPFEPQALLLVGDPFSFPVEAFLDWAGRHHPGLPVVGGMASAARGPGGNRIALGTRVRSTGALAVLLGPGAELATVVSQGCRPFGQPMVVTAARRNLIVELAGRPALEQLVAHARRSLTEDDGAVLEQGGLHVGRVLDEHRDRFGPGDFLVRNVLGADRSSGAIAVGDEVPVGTTVQFHLRDAAGADADLRALVGAQRADAALVFTCNGRGTRLFGRPHHDVGVVAELLGPVPVAGFFAAGELGPVGGRNFLHGFTASVALLRERRTPPPPPAAAAGGAADGGGPPGRF